MRITTIQTGTPVKRQGLDTETVINQDNSTSGGNKPILVQKSIKDYILSKTRPKDTRDVSREGGEHPNMSDQNKKEQETEGPANKAKGSDLSPARGHYEPSQAQ